MSTLGKGKASSSSVSREGRMDVVPLVQYPKAEEKDACFKAS